ncbi:CheB methylesterase domain-containing protein [Mesobacterium sp. TK19101]|uniref:protein-glutamate methylesterase n=1 Tax=Mesobacterium hydrothermale TaxID=3111907 RepID=A0ABU6HKT6_9RHOB|nr:CheB methylesterase domain-containing protein [Mesobacterium sp. TK19101]MEC3862524.1 CheB methylesterase domain-containing protein [Mesobacterium sp. TK19101]
MTLAHISLVLAVTDGATRSKLKDLLARMPEMRLAAATQNLMETFAAVEETQPQAVLISHAMTRFPEFEVMRGLFSAMGIRWIMLEDRATPQQRAKAGLFPIDISTDIETIHGQLKAVLRNRSAPSAHTRRTVQMPRTRPGALILIGASTGGVDALSRVLGAFPANCPPTFAVQHTGRGFGEGLVRLLDRQCAANVISASDGADVGPGTICIGAGLQHHLAVDSQDGVRARLMTGGAVSGHRPSVDVLFRSALPVARKTVAALLTGMGRDGADGLLALHENGARTVCQDEETSVVYGMPRAAAELGAADEQVPLNRIAERLLSLAAQPGEVGV